MNYSVDYWSETEKSRLSSLPKEVDTAIFQVTPDGDAGSRAIAEMARGSDFRLMTGTTVTELVSDEDGTRIDLVRLIHADGTRSVLNAHVFVLAAGALDNTRLLLASNNKWKNGLGNVEDMVGRYFMEHPGVRSSILVPHDSSLIDRSGLYRLHTVRGTRIIGTLTLAENVVRREGLLNAAIFLEPSDDLRASDVYRSMAMFSPQGIRNMRWSLSVYAANLANVVRHPVKAVSTLIGFVNPYFPPRRRVFDLRVVSEQDPNRDSRVFLDTKRDSRGLQQVRLDWRFTELDKWSIRRTQEILRDSFRKARLGALEHLYGEERPPARIHGQRHQMGTTRMHPDPKRGVVDSDSKVHGLHNLFVTGSSVFPTGGHANTTLTIMALALRLADHLADLFEKHKGIKPQ
jgi:choline dehydrogenase-like flavoprotein